MILQAYSLHSFILSSCMIRCKVEVKLEKETNFSNRFRTLYGSLLLTRLTSIHIARVPLPDRIYAGTDRAND